MVEKYGDVELDFSAMAGMKIRIDGWVQLAITTIAAELAEATEEEITVNNQVDTGAMRVSVYLDISGDGTLSASMKSRVMAIGDATSLAAQPGRKSGRTHKFMPEDNITWVPQGEFQAKVALSADYAVYQEIRIPFLLTAYDQVSARVPYIVAVIIQAG